MRYLSHLDTPGRPAGPSGDRFSDGGMRRGTGVAARPPAADAGQTGQWS